MKKRTAILLTILPVALLFSYTPALAAPSFQNLVAEAAILAEVDSGTILYERSASKRHPADALTRVMTLLLAVSAVESDEVSEIELVEMTESAWFDIAQGSSTQSIMPGEEMTFLDLMYSAFVGGAGEAGNLIAERLAGSVEDFIEKMNRKAVELGCTDTYFTNTHGRYDPDQYTTAHDLFIIYSTAIKSALFIEISGVYRHITESTDVSEPRNLISSNSLLNQNGKYFYRYCLSGIGSSTYEGGYSLVAYAEEGGLSFISVVLGSDVITLEDESTDMRNLSESRRLFEWGFSNFAWRDILKESDLVDKVPVLHGSGADFVNARPVSSVTLLLSNAITDELFTRDITIFSEVNDTPLIAPVSAGDILGEVKIIYDGVEIATVLLVANTSIELHGFEYIRRQIVDMLSTAAARYIMIILVVLILAYVALVVRYNVIRARRLRRIKNAKEDLVRERQQNFRE